MPFFVLVMFLKVIYEAVSFMRKTVLRNPNHCVWVACTHTCSMPQMRGVRSPVHTAVRCVL